MRKQVFFIVIIFAFLNFQFVENYEYDTSAERRIINGREVRDHKYPFMAAILKKDTNIFRCSGTIIRTDWILTVSHCVRSRRPDDLLIRVGSIEANNGGQLLDVLKVVNHLNRSAGENDVALLGVGNKMKLSATVGILEMIDENYIFPPPGIYVLILGYGPKDATAAGQRLLLREAEIPLMDIDVCNYIYYYHSIKVKDSMFCLDGLAQNQGGGGGDSGSPAIYNNKIIGILSWSKNFKNLAYPLVYQSVDHFRPWIDNVIATNSL